MVWILILLPNPCPAQSLEEVLQGMTLTELAEASRIHGDAARGAVVFFQPQLACSKCHLIGKKDSNWLGPDLSLLSKDTSNESLIESILHPSKAIRQGYESVTVLLSDGTTLTAILVEKNSDRIIVKDVSRNGEQVSIPAADVEQVRPNELSIMPTGQVNQLNSPQQFFDLIRYLMEIRDGGSERAMQLQPPASLLVFTIPEYENHLDHAGLIKSWNEESLKRGEAIYKRVCANCHGTMEQPGSLPTSLRFAQGKFKNGSDPLSMYRTLTHGFGLMTPQTWMVPSQKYDVIHYIREAYLKPHNTSQWTAIDAAYYAKLPSGDTFGPKPSEIEVWSAMDYGTYLSHTIQVPGTKENFAYKGIAVRLDPGAGGVSRGRHWMLFDTDTLRFAAGWSAGDKPSEVLAPSHATKSDEKSRPKSNFIDWKGIQFDGEHGVHPSIVGTTTFRNATGPGWAYPGSNSFRDDQRVLGRDGKRYGPLPKSWGKFHGFYQYGQRVIFSYSIGGAEVLESPSLSMLGDSDSPPRMLRSLQIGPREKDLVIKVADFEGPSGELKQVHVGDPSIVRLSDAGKDGAIARGVRFDGGTYLELKDADALDTDSKDYSIVAKIRTEQDGSIWSLTMGEPQWVHDGLSLFIRDGKLSFDIGWVGAIGGKSKISDGRWHTVALTWKHSTKKARLFVDGKLEAEGLLAPKRPLKNRVVRVGYTSSNFPDPNNYFQGSISEVRFYQEQLSEGPADIGSVKKDLPSLVAQWSLDGVNPGSLDGRNQGASEREFPFEVRRVPGLAKPNPVALIAGVASGHRQLAWEFEDGNLSLRIPAGDERLRFSIWLASDNAQGNEPTTRASAWTHPPALDTDIDLNSMIGGGPARWPERLVTQAVMGSESGPFAIDILTAPESNPWLAQMRFTGLDFFDDGRIAVCTWDGDVWVITPDSASSGTGLQWQRIATGLFQPLGIKIVQGKIHLTCRDQLAVLHDLNGDGETDFYQCLNHDHQVTEHFHEFAMGLQTDSVGNFYYAKSGCHGKAAVVPHHGTLLRVSPDGSSTEILANGFRAANGVCLNPDGSFVVTDQEGFWNPKNRINWVTVSPSGKPNFYGNMLGYHEVTDSSDSAMEPPLCWITNAFDRSPAELLWVDSPRWGPLNGSLMNLSYGYGKVFLVPHESVDGRMQGGMIELPIPTFPTGVMRGRFHPKDQQLYLCGMYAWAGNATHPGGLYRIRTTGQPMYLPVALHATRSGIDLVFTESLDAASVDLQKIHIKTWSLKRSAKYGSEHLDEKVLAVKNASLSNDGKRLHLEIADLRATWCMEIQYTLRAKDGTLFQGTLHNTIHALAD